MDNPVNRCIDAALRHLALLDVDRRACNLADTLDGSGEALVKDNADRIAHLADAGSAAGSQLVEGLDRIVNELQDAPKASGEAVRPAASDRFASEDK